MLHDAPAEEDTRDLVREHGGRERIATSDSIGAPERPFHGEAVRDPFSVRFLTYNFFAPPFPTEVWKNQRLDIFVKYLRNYDIVCMQEMFQLGAGAPRVRRMMRAAAEAGLIYQAGGPTPPAFSGQLIDGGLMILSRFPIVEVDMCRYSAGAHVDQLATKGSIHARVMLCARPYTELHVFTTHFQASYAGAEDVFGEEAYRSARFAQAAQLRAFIERRTAGSRAPVVVCGDLNVNARHTTASHHLDGVPAMETTDPPEQTEYALLMSVIDPNGLGFDLLCMAPDGGHGAHPITFGDVGRDPMTDQVVPRETQLTRVADFCRVECLDYIFFWRSAKDLRIAPAPAPALADAAALSAAVAPAPGPLKAPPVPSDRASRLSDGVLTGRGLSLSPAAAAAAGRARSIVSDGRSTATGSDFGPSSDEDGMPLTPAPAREAGAPAPGGRVLGQVPHDEEEEEEEACRSAAIVSVMHWLSGGRDEVTSPKHAPATRASRRPMIVLPDLARTRVQPFFVRPDHDDFAQLSDHYGVETTLCVVPRAAGRALLRCCAKAIQARPPARSPADLVCTPRSGPRDCSAELAAAAAVAAQARRAWIAAHASARAAHGGTAGNGTSASAGASTSTSGSDRLPPLAPPSPPRPLSGSGSGGGPTPTRRRRDSSCDSGTLLLAGGGGGGGGGSSVDGSSVSGGSGRPGGAQGRGSGLPVLRTSHAVPSESVVIEAGATFARQIIHGVHALSEQTGVPPHLREAVRRAVAKAAAEATARAKGETGGPLRMNGIRPRVTAMLTIGHIGTLMGIGETVAAGPLADAEQGCGAATLPFRRSLAHHDAMRETYPHKNVNHLSCSMVVKPIFLLFVLITFIAIGVALVKFNVQYATP